MTVSKEMLETLEDCGKCQFPLDKTAIIMEMDLKALEFLMQDKTGDVYKTYNRGRLLAEFEVRKSILNLAQQNSSQAQELFLKLRNELKLSEA